MRVPVKTAKYWTTGIVILLCFIFLLLSSGRVWAAESRVTEAKGHGLLSLVNRWEKKSVKEQVYSPDKEVLGFYTKDWSTDTLSHDSLKKNADKITGVATFTYKVTSEGKLVGKAPKAALKVSRQKDIETLALVHNLSTTGFNRELIHSILTDPDARAKTISDIYKTLVKNGFDGVNIDFENISPKDRQYLNYFIEELKAKLGPDALKVTISVPAKTWDNPTDGWSGAFDYNHLAKTADKIMLMSYDEHWLGGSPGPVASQPWVEKVAAYSSSVIPGNKVLLGIGNYGYDWIVGEAGHKTVQQRNAVALALNHGAEIQWDGASQTPYFNYWKSSKKHVVWFESIQSAAFKLELVRKYGLAGIAIWRLGFEAPGFWDVVDEKFNSSN